MIAELECIVCIIDDLIGALKLLSLNNKDQEIIIKKSLKFLHDSIPFGKEPSYYITRVHRILKEVSGLNVLFKELRGQCNQIGLKIAKKIEENIKDLDDFERFHHLIEWSIAGNHMDFRTIGAGYGMRTDDASDVLQGIVCEGLKVDSIGEIFSAVKGARQILFIHDNVGEIALDKLLIKEMTKYCKAIISALRGGAITSDAIVEDGIEVGIDEVSADLILAGPDTLGISWEEMSPQLREALNESDLVISKGQANFYVLSQHKSEINCPIICLLRTKCDLVSGYFGHKGIINVAAFL